MVVEGCGHVGGGVLGGQRVLTLSTECAGARERIVHMSTALPPPRPDRFAVQPVGAGTRLNGAARALVSSSEACTSVSARASL